RLVANESSRASERFDYLYERFILPYWQDLFPVMERLKTAGRMPSVPLDVLFGAIMGPALASTHDAVAHRIGRPGSRSEEEMREASDALLRLVLGGLLPGADLS